VCVETCQRRYTSAITVWCDHSDRKLTKAIDAGWKGFILLGMMIQAVKSGLVTRADQEGKVVNVKAPHFVALIAACQKAKAGGPAKLRGESRQDYTKRKELYCGAARDIIVHYILDCRVRIAVGDKPKPHVFATRAKEAAAGIRAAYDELDANFAAQKAFMDRQPKQM